MNAMCGQSRRQATKWLARQALFFLNSVAKRQTDTFPFRIRTKVFQHLTMEWRPAASAAQRSMLKHDRQTFQQCPPGWARTGGVYYDLSEAQGLQDWQAESCFARSNMRSRCFASVSLQPPRERYQHANEVISCDCAILFHPASSQPISSFLSSTKVQQALADKQTAGSKRGSRGNFPCELCAFQRFISDPHSPEHPIPQLSTPAASRCAFAGMSPPKIFLEPEQNHEADPQNGSMISESIGPDHQASAPGDLWVSLEEPAAHLN